MKDTQETNLPLKEEIATEDMGKLEESQAPEVSTVETTAESEITVEELKTDVINEESEAEVIEEETIVEAIVEESVMETGITDEESVAETNIVDEEAVVEVNNADEASVAETEITVEEPVAEADVVIEAETVNNESAEQQSSDDIIEEEIIKPLDASALAIITKSEILERLEKVAAEPKKYTRSEADILKQAYYKIRRAETEDKKKEFLEGGGEEKDFVIAEDGDEVLLKSLIAGIKEKRAAYAIEEERDKEANLVIKQHLIERLKVLTESQDDFNKRYNEFRDIQRKWREIRNIPQEYSKELWRNYQLYNERFYDIVKINNQFRDYDFKKNLEMKSALCETVERLATDEPDVISAFHQLQKLHQQWREIGPVSKEFRESIWERFKEASTIINKKHQTHFEGLKEQEEKNFEEKKNICESIEAINFEVLKTMRDWEKKTDEVISLQAKWRTIGFATKRQNIKIFERFRTACDNYFNKKGEFYKSIKQEMDKNLELKKALIEKAESMKESTDWKETTKVFVEIQNEWKKIGPVARKYSEPIWKQFISICDYFFENKNKEASSQKTEEIENLEAKKVLIEKIETIDESLNDEESLTLLRSYISEWNNIGFVPFREKDKLHKSFKDAVDKQFDRLKVNARDRRVQQYRTNIAEISGSGKNKLFNERDKLMRIYEKMKSEVQTYENNIGFLNISSKGGDGLMKEMDRKIANLKEEMDVVVKKIEAIDENLD